VNFIRPSSIDAQRMLHVIVKVHGLSSRVRCGKTPSSKVEKVQKDGPAAR
jgi:hypothetical protein